MSQQIESSRNLGSDLASLNMDMDEDSVAPSSVAVDTDLSLRLQAILAEERYRLYLSLAEESCQQNNLVAAAKFVRNGIYPFSIMHVSALSIKL